MFTQVQSLIPIYTTQYSIVEYIQFLIPIYISFQHLFYLMSSNNVTISTFKEFMERYNDYDRAFKLTRGITKMFNRETSFRPRS